MAKKRPKKKKRVHRERVTIRDFPPDAILHERYPGENIKRWEAFVLYRDMHERRSHAAVARGVGKCANLISRWAREDRWTERIESFEAWRASVAAQALAKSQKEYFARQIKAGRALEDLARKLVKEKFKDAKDARIKISELLRMIELSFKLQREIAVGRSQVAITGPMGDEDDEPINNTNNGIEQPSGAPTELAIPLTFGGRMGELMEIYDRCRARAGAEVAGFEVAENPVPPQAAP